MCGVWSDEEVEILCEIRRGRLLLRAPRGAPRRVRRCVDVCVCAGGEGLRPAAGGRTEGSDFRDSDSARRGIGGIGDRTRFRGRIGGGFPPSKYAWDDPHM